VDIESAVHIVNKMGFVDSVTPNKLAGEYENKGKPGIIIINKFSTAIKHSRVRPEAKYLIEFLTQAEYDARYKEEDEEDVEDDDE
jgi:hypothetical protein